MLGIGLVLLVAGVVVWVQLSDARGRAVLQERTLWWQSTLGSLKTEKGSWAQVKTLESKLVAGWHKVDEKNVVGTDKIYARSGWSTGRVVISVRFSDAGVVSDFEVKTQASGF